MSQLRPLKLSSHSSRFALSLALILINIYIHSLGARKITLAQRAITFDDFRSGKKLIGSHLITHWKTGKSICVKLCNRNALCVSVNSCSNRKCELNFGKVFSLNTTLIDDTACDYLGLRKNQTPACQDGSDLDAERLHTDSRHYTDRSFVVGIYVCERLIFVFDR